MPKPLKATSSVTLKGAPKLVVEFSDISPKFDFSGEWGIRHILTIERLIGRAYRNYQRTTRHNLVQPKEG